MKTALTVILLFLLSFSVLAQETTEDEYDYLTYGIRVQLDSDLGMKKGYYFDFEDAYDFGEYVFETKALMREKDNSWAGTLVIVHSRKVDASAFICIPTPFCDYEIRSKYEKKIQMMKVNPDKEMLAYYTNVISDYYGRFLVLFLNKKNTFPKK